MVTFPVCYFRAVRGEQIVSTDPASVGRQLPATPKDPSRPRLPTDLASVEAVIASFSEFRHCFHRHGVGGERKTGRAAWCLAGNRRSTDAGSVEGNTLSLGRHC